MRIVTLNALRAGIERLRTKGGAKPDALYDLLNGYVAIDGSVRSRPGTLETATLPAGTKGLCAFDGKLVVFSHTAVVMPASTPAIVCELVIHPDNPALALTHIHFAAAFLGSLYVVAEFSNGDTRHFWLRSAPTWNASGVRELGVLVQPTTPNGYLYRATRLRPPGLQWAPNVARAVNDRVEPTVANGYEYVAITTIGTQPRSGATEPVWPAQNGATVVEDTRRESTQESPTTGTVEPPTTVVDEGTRERYGGGMAGRNEGVRRQLQ